MAADLYQRAIARAAEILGGRQWLAVYLGTDVAQLGKWSARGRPPLAVVIALTQVLQHALISNYVRTGAPARRRNSRSRTTRALRRRRKRS